jgi:very-short-patch-repair endonuclease
MLHLPLPHTAKTRGFFTRDEAAALGWTERAMRTQLHRRVWTKLAPGRYAETGVLKALTRDGQHRLIALATAYERKLVVRRDSAACVHGFAVARTPRLVSTRHISEFDERDVMQVSGVSVTTPAYTVVECARFLKPREGLVVADSAMRSNKVTQDEVAEQLAAIPENGKGTVTATFVVSEADPRAESAFESISRYEFIVAGLPRAESQAWVGNKRLDFLWEKYRLIGEADGLTKYGTNEEEVRLRIKAERRRQRELEDAGYVFVRWLWDEIWFTPHVVVARVMEKLQRAGYSAS